MWFVLALVTVLLWSGSDIFYKQGSAVEDAYSHWKLVITVGTVMGLHAAVMLILARIPGIDAVIGERLAAELPAAFSLRDMLTYLPASACYIVSMFLGYIGLRYLELSVSTPICNSSGAVVAVLCFAFRGQTLMPLQTVGVVCISAGVFLLSLFEYRDEERARRLSGEVIDRKYRTGAVAIVFPLVYCVIDALGTYMDGLLLLETDEVTGEVISGVIAEAPANIAYELTFALMAAGAFVYVRLIRRQRIIAPREKTKWLAAVCETAGQLTYVYALAGNTQVAAPLISSYCLFSVLWARVFLKERLTVRKYAAIGVAVFGIVLLGIAEGN